MAKGRGFSANKLKELVFLIMARATNIANSLQTSLPPNIISIGYRILRQHIVGAIKVDAATRRVRFTVWKSKVTRRDAASTLEPYVRNR
jgi:hypothetical protein